MLICIRTTINLPDALVEAVKAKASAEGRTFTSLVEEGLREALAPTNEDIVRPALPAYGDPDGATLVDLLDRDALWDALDGERSP